MKKGTFVALKHPYEWNIKKKPTILHSYIENQKDSALKVNNSSFDKSVYKENLKKQDPISHGKEIAQRLNYMNREDLNKSAFMNTKYLKNFSTIGGGSSPLKSTYQRNSILNDAKSMTNFYKNSRKNTEVSSKVGQNFKVSFKFPIFCE